MPDTRRPPRALWDVAIVGGSAAGLAAALQLARQRRAVVVVDAGEPRNAPAEHMHGYLGHDGLPPAELLAIGRAEVGAYGAEIISGRVLEVGGEVTDGFHLTLDHGPTIAARRVIAATGLVDELPDIEGLAEHWGRDVIHCPFCHGFEVRGERLVQIVTHPAGLHQSVLLRQLTDDLTTVVHGEVAVALDALDGLVRDGIRVHVADVGRVLAEGGHVRGVELADGTTVEAQRIVVGPRFRARTSAFTGVGLAPVSHPSGLGAHLVTDEAGQTTTKGVYAAGNVTDPSHQVLHAAADGSRVGARVAADLAHEDHQRRIEHRTGDHAFDRAYWDRHWSGVGTAGEGPGANPHLTRELAHLEPGTALDAGCGAGAEAIWLAEAGWVVHGVDISAGPLDRARRRSAELALADRLHWHEADLTTWDPPRRFDLVVTSYAHAAIPQLELYARIQHWVAPGGTLLVVAHGRHAHDDPGHRPGLADRDEPPGEATVTADAVTAVLAPGDWVVASAYEASRTAIRPGGTVTLHDVVVRATRRS
jgi:thioredoxin reductase/protein-L-isoaspartate O-methyltransferase